MHVIVTQYLMKKEDGLKENHSVNNLEKQGIESSMNHDILIITPLDGRKSVDETSETICSKQLSYSPFMDLPSQEFGYFGSKTNKRNDGSSE